VQQADDPDAPRLMAAHEVPYHHYGRVQLLMRSYLVIREERLIMRQHVTPRPSRSPPMSPWRRIGLYFYCLLLSALVAVLAAIIGTAPHWIARLMRW
jgi:hypothetical protein